MSTELHNSAARINIENARDLLHSLVPRAQCFCFYDTLRQCAWSSDDTDDFEIENFVADLPGDFVAGRVSESKHLRCTLTSGRTLLVLPVKSGEDICFGMLVMVFSRNAGKSSSFNPDALAKILAPAIAVIGDGLHLSQHLQRSNERVAGAEADLKLVYEIDEKIHGTSHRHAGLAELVGQSGRSRGIAYSVLLIPSKRIRISATHSSWKSVNRKVLDRYLVDHLLPKLDGRRSPAVFDIPGTAESNDVAERGYQSLLCPLLDKHGNTEGVLAQLGRVDNQSFSTTDRRFMAHIARKIEYVIEQSFDAMTGQMNRSGFEVQLQESYRALPPEGDMHQLLYFDLDKTQLVNDTFGRAAGDAVIRGFARLLEKDLPNSAVISRLSGDEFCILLTHADSDAAMDFAQEIRKKGSALRYLEGDKSLQITMSIGIAELSKRTNDGGQALTASRLACQAAKDHGRDRVEVFDDQDQSMVRRHDDMQLVTQIQQSLDGDEFELLAQPIVSLKDPNGCPRFEVLLRMKDDSGYVPSGAFFSAAERYQMMPQIDRWVVSTTIARLAENLRQVEGHGAIFSINLSGQSLGDDGILAFIEDELAAGGVPACSVCFEITESAAISNLAKAQSFIDALRVRGCSISLDDFGAGLSSFAYLKNFKVDTLKIDGSFVRDITKNRISESMVAAITQVAKVMDLTTVAEYVESSETRKLIAGLGVDFAQGHSVGKPIPLVEALRGLDDEVLTSIA